MLNRPMKSLDVETTTLFKGDPYCATNKLVSLVCYSPESTDCFYKHISIDTIQTIVDTHTLILANGKFDLAWLRRIGIDLSNAQVFDIQYAEYLLSNQTIKYPSVEGMAVKYLQQHKIDKIKLEYWDKGIDTWFIPEQELLAYNIEDCRLEYEIYLKQIELLKECGKYHLCLIHNLDLLVLEEMQWNGILYDVEESEKKATSIETEINQLSDKLKQIAGFPAFDTNSNDHLSALLYGGEITTELKVPIGVYKTGAKVGHTRYKNIKEVHTLPRLVEPLAKTEYKKGNVWSTEEDVLKSIKLTKETKIIVNLILELRGLNKLVSTYLRGFPKIIRERQWENNYLHSTLNQCVTITGRLSSTKPNQQNLDGNTKQFCISRY